MRRRIERAVIFGLALCAAACGNGMSMHVGDDKGVRLAELDKSGPAPTGLALASQDKVVISEGDALTIAVTGDPAAVEALRFNLDDGTLGIMRERGTDVRGRATISVTMPPAREIVLAGSGDIQAPSLVGKAEVAIAGSGDIAVARVAANDLRVSVMGSGTLTAIGTAENLEFNVAGSGDLAAPGLKVQRAEVNIAGSGGGAFASDGTVNANIAGSGVVTVHGRAQCKTSKVGSGSLRCTADAGGGSNAAPTASVNQAAPGTRAIPNVPPAG